MQTDLRANFDWLVLTAANARQARAYELQLARRVGHGALSSTKGAFAIPDARDARIGSGAATVLALAELARRILRAKRAASLQELFAGERVLMLHSGGDSRRLPMYAVEGKLFAPVPRPARGTRCATVFDLLVEDLATLAPREGGELLVGAGDAVIGFSRAERRAQDGASLAFSGAGVVGVAQRAPLERASRHGVFVAPARGGLVRGFLQKPGLDAMRAHGAVLDDGRALVDLGLFSFDPRSAAALLAGAGVELVARRIRFAKGGLADLASRAAVPPVDLYREIAMALPAQARRAAYLAECDPRLATPLAALFDALRKTRFAVEVAEVGDFLHIGSMREMLAALCGPSAQVRAFGVDADSCPVPPRRVRGRRRPATLDSVVESASVARGEAIVDASVLGDARLGGDNIVVGLEARTLRIPRGIACFTLPVARGTAEVACGVGDDFKTRLDAGGTFLGRGFSRFLASAGISAEEVAAGDGTLWDARLWTIGASADGGGVAWMWQGMRAPAKWRRAPRKSMRELLVESDSAAVLARRAAVAASVAAGAPAAAFELAARAGDIDELHRTLVASPRGLRVRMLGAGTRASLRAIPEPLVRAHATATLACVAGSLGERSARAAGALRADAFSAVGDAVLSTLELPSRPVPAAILHDQAVWTSTPVRVDLAGGWTDTPPICNAVGGSVVNVAVALRGQLPIQVVAKLDETLRGDEPAIRITSTDLGETRVIRSARDLSRRGDPTRWSSLAENALVLTGAAPADPKASLARWLRAVGGGISLTMFSAVPKGSGLGTSSILGAATIQCLDRMFARERGAGGLFAATSALEQMLSTRGGWQDQVGGVVGGFKIARTGAGPAQVPATEPLAVPPRLADELRARCVLYFTGQRRMAKNILETVVWNWLAHEPSAIRAVDGLHANAGRMRAALLAGDADAFAGEIGEYMRLKRLIDPGCCPAAFDELALRWRRELASWSFAGAGGGGFMLLVAKDARRAAAIRASVERDPAHPRARAFDFEVDPAGLRCAVL